MYFTSGVVVVASEEVGFTLLEVEEVVGIVAVVVLLVVLLLFDDVFLEFVVGGIVGCGGATVGESVVL